MTDFAVTGTDYNGIIRGATLVSSSAAGVAKHLYDEGWQHAEITVDGRTVGAVTRDLNGKRTWWGEKAGAQPKPTKPVRRRARAEVRS